MERRFDSDRMGPSPCQAKLSLSTGFSAMAGGEGWGEEVMATVRISLTVSSIVSLLFAQEEHGLRVIKEVLTFIG